MNAHDRNATSGGIGPRPQRSIRPDDGADCRGRPASIRVSAMPDETVAALSDVTRTYGGVPVLDSVSLTVEPGLTAVIGPNGSGKSTLLGGARRRDGADSG